MDALAACCGSPLCWQSGSSELIFSLGVSQNKCFQRGSNKIQPGGMASKGHGVTANCERSESIFWKWFRLDEVVREYIWRIN